MEYGGTAFSSESGEMIGGENQSSMYKKGGNLKPIPKGNKGLPKLPKSVRNKMGYMEKGGSVGSSFENGEIVWDNVNKSYGVVLNNYGGNGSYGEIRLDSDGNQPIENLHKLGSKGDKGTKKQLDEALKSHKRLVDNYGYEKVSYSKGGKMEWGGTAESSETGTPIGGENQSSMYKRGGHVSKGEMVWKKLSSAERIKFLLENFTPEITPRSQEILVSKPYNFLPKNVKIKFEAKYANVENYGEGGGTGVSSETGTPIGGENQSSMFGKGGSTSSFEYTIGGL